MKLKRTFIDGQEVYVPLTVEEEKAYTEKEENNNNKENKSADYINVEKGPENVFTTVNEKIKMVANIVGDSVGNAVGTAFEKTGSFVKKSLNSEENKARKNSNEKNRKLAKLLPYLSEEDIHDLINKITEGDETTKDLNINVILPYLSSEDAGAFLLRCIKDGNSNVKVALIVKYVDSMTFDILVEMYINGQLKDIDIEDLLPYLSDKNIKRIFEYEILNKK